MLAEVPYELKKHYSEGRLIPFVGAGVSMSVKWPSSDPTRGVCRGPSWTELVNKAAELLGFTLPDLLRKRGTDLQILEYFRAIHHGEMARLTNWLHCEMQPPEEALKNASILSALAALDRCPIFYTTNFDNFIERAFDLAKRPYKTVALESDMVRTRGECEIIKFHGDLDHPAQMVLSESDYDKRLSFSTPLDFRLRSDLLNRVVLFVGYSFRDYNVAYLFRVINETLRSNPGALSGPRAYILVSDPSNFEFKLFRARNISVIAVEGANMTDSVTQFLHELGASP